MGWRRFVMVALGGFAATLLILGAFVLLMNPYGNLPRLLFSEHVITDVNQRFQFPALIRSRRYDSLLIGTSDSALLPPDDLERVFGGQFANLAMNAGTPYEQYRLADLFMREVETPRTLVIGVDHVWCDENADDRRMTFRGFPEWMYDADWHNDLPYMLNGKTVELSGRRLRQALGFREARFVDGYEVFTPPESAYDKAKVRTKLWGGKTPGLRPPRVPAHSATLAERAAWDYPALVWLDEILSRFTGREVLAFMPAHVVAQPRPGSAKAARQEECKARIAALAQRHNAVFIDFNIASAITSNDDNYWDPLHYRLPIASRIVADIEQALATGKDDPDGDFRYLVGPSTGTASPTSD